ncbi:MAG: LytTR family DNA-binding domain-containing protein [Oscillospiraceae bacterium]|nr:LytTR family DNA-binding domain-containing protein [Oscillospiraceae bacterium]
MRIAICDDEKTFTSDFTAIISNLYKSLDMTVDEFSSGKALLNSFQTKPYDLVFLDIEMPEMDGFSLAGQLRQQNEDVSIVFVTGHKEYAIDGYGYNALRYLLKPVKEKEVHEILEYVLEKQNNKKFIWLTNRDGRQRVKISDIVSIEAHNQNLIFNTISGSIEIRDNINRYEKELKSDGFFRLHRSYLVSLAKITKISEKEVMVADKFRVPIARTKKREFQDAFFSFVNQEAF